MRLKEQLRSVLLSVLANKFRVFLTSLGIIIGSFTIIMVVGIGTASSDAVAAQYSRLSVNSITISRARVAMSMGANGPTTQALTAAQLLAMPEQCPHVTSVGISTTATTSIAYMTTSESVSVQGINEAFASITNLNIDLGDWFTDDDGTYLHRYAVLGCNVAAYLFGSDYSGCVGDTVLIKGLQFTVAGVLQRVGGTGGVSGGSSPTSSGSADDMVFIPYNVAIKYTSGSQGTGGAISRAQVIGGSAAGGPGTASYVALADSSKDVATAVSEIQDYISGIMGDTTSYTVTDAGSTLQSALSTSNTMSGLLMAVAAIVLIVSGIGIMNVLLVAVKERTREIGIMKAIGSPRRVILLEFLFEAIFISVVGGLIGVLLSYFAPRVMSLFSIAYTASPTGLILGFGFAVVTGVFFGYYPAYKASKLKPIDALNAE